MPAGLDGTVSQGVTIENLAGAQMGSIAFLSNLMREIFSFFMIPWIAKHLNYYSCIAPAGGDQRGYDAADDVQIHQRRNGGVVGDQRRDLLRAGAGSDLALF